MKGDFEHPLNLSLELARWLALASLVTTVFSAFYEVIRHESRLFRLLRKHEHIIICGLGRVGLQLARDLAARGEHVVALEPGAHDQNALTAREAGVTVISGDASDPDDLRRVRVAKAKQVIAVCHDEQTNIAVAAAVGQILADPKTTRKLDQPLECWIFIPDEKLRRVLQQDRVFPNTNPGSNYKVNVSGMNLFDLAARQVFTESPLDHNGIGPDDPHVVHLVIVGFGEMGRHLALQAARIGHFANFKKLKITVLENKPAANPRVQSFLDEYKMLPQICDFNVIDLASDMDAVPAQLAALDKTAASTRERVTFAFCWDSQDESTASESELLRQLERDDPVNLAWALELRQLDEHSKAAIVVFQTRARGFGALFPAKNPGAVLGDRMRAFGMIEQTCSVDSMLHGREDQIARAFHSDWLEIQLKKGRKIGDKPSLQPWEKLTLRLLDSNRHAADHIPIKLRALGYRIAPLDQAPAAATQLSEIKGPDLELLAKMEHQRWWVDHLLNGYTYAPGDLDDVKKTSGCLVEWDKLDLGTQDYDRNQVKSIPRILTEKAKRGIYRQSA